MITIVGLELSYDEGRTNTDNLYRQLFGRWPESSSTDIEERGENDDRLTTLIEKLLLQRLMFLKHGEAVCAFFGICCNRLECQDESELKDVETGLQEIREEMREEVLLLLQERSHGELRILNYCAALSAKLQRFQDEECKSEEQKEGDFLKTATLYDIGLDHKDARIYNALQRRWRGERDENNAVLLKGIVCYTRKQFMKKAKGVGVRMADDLARLLADYGLYFRGEN